MMPVADDAIVEAPPPGRLELSAVTSTRTVQPTSVLVSLRELAVAPAMALQLPPEPSQRSHWYAIASGVEPAHVPAVEVSFCVS